MIKKLGLLLFVLLPSTSYANLLQSGFYAEYDVQYNGIDLGVSKRRLSVKNNTATYQADTIPEGFAALLINETIKETSQVIINRKNIRPVQYIQEKNKKNNIEKIQLDFNWNKKQLTNSYLKTSEKLKANTHDLLSFQLNIMRDLQNNKTSMQYHIATKKHSRKYQLEVVGKELIETPLGEFNIVKLKSKPLQDKSRFIFWCAPTLEYLPVKIQKVNEKGDEFSFSLRAFSISK